MNKSLLIAILMWIAATFVLTILISFEVGLFTAPMIALFVFVFFEYVYYEKKLNANGN